MTELQQNDEFMMYAAAAGRYDEMWSADGEVRPHWREFADEINRLGIEELLRRRQHAERLLGEIGITYNVHSDDPDQNRPWALDPVPFILSPEDWATIEAGLIERAALLDLILKDLYGPRQLIKQGIIPPELIFNHAGFLLPCDQTLIQEQRALSLYAVDLVRDSDGRFRILGERTQVPSGAGYALESRVTANRVLPDVFRTMQIRRLDSYFIALREGLRTIAPSQKEQPNIVVFTPGPEDPSYFEHAYLSSYLGYPLVQGDDLTIRDTGVWLKSIDGLQQVDIILRRVYDYDCDPLELSSNSISGAPGLMEAVRHRLVTVVNPIGSSVLENPGLLAFLPAIARYFGFGELSIPSAATWWCGQPDEANYVLDNLEHLIIKSIDRTPDPKTIIGSQLTEKEAAAWRENIAAHPHHYAAQEQLRLSTSPALIEDRLVPRPAILRCFLSANGETYTVMPGGLTRTAAGSDDVIITSETGAVSKDTWVLTDTVEPHRNIWLHSGRTEPDAAFRTALPSRTAENLYWMGRYAERAEVTARLFRIILQKMTERDELDDEVELACLHTLLRTLSAVTDIQPGFIGAGAARRLKKPEAELFKILCDYDSPGSLACTLRSMKYAAYRIRERWSTDFWRVIDDTEEHLDILRSVSQFSLRHARDNLDQLVTDLVALSGLSMESMTRELGWIMLDSGRRLERALLLIVQLRTTLTRHMDEPVESLVLEALLKGHESLITYRRRYYAYLQRQTVMDLLIMDDTNPRALIYQLDRLQEQLAQLPYDRSEVRMSEEERCLLEAASMLRLYDIPGLVAEQGKRGRYTGLERLLTQLETLLKRSSDLLVNRFFSHTEPRQRIMTPYIGHDA